MNYNDWLCNELNIYKRENKLLNDKLENLNTMFNEVHDNELETRNKKKDILKWAYSLEKENKKLKSTQQELINDVRKYSCKYLDLEKENKQLKQQIEGLTSENFELQNSLFTEQLNEDETNDYIDRLKNELFNAHLNKQHNERLILELKTAISSYNNFVDEMFPD